MFYIIIIKTLNENGEIPNSFAFSVSLNVDHQSVVGVIKSLETDLLIKTEQLSEQFWELSEEAQSVIEVGSPGKNFMVSECVMNRNPCHEVYSC